MATENRRLWNATDKRYARMAEKKQHVLQIAQDVFIRNGYNRTSMDAIAQEAGVSKMTIYRQFGDKQSLFIACMNDQCAEMLTLQKYTPAINRNDAKTQLLHYGKLIVELITRPDIVMLYRMLIGEITHFPLLGEIFYTGGPNRAIQVVEHILSNLFEQPECRLRSQAFFWASLGDTYERIVLGIIDPTEAKNTFETQTKLAASMVLSQNNQ